MTPRAHPVLPSARTATLSALVLVALLTAGCSDPLAATDLVGRYELRRVRNESLPVFWPGPGDEPRRLLGSALILAPDRTATWVTRVEELSGPGAPRIVEHQSTWVYYVDERVLTLRTAPCEARVCAGGIAKTELRVLGPTLIGSTGTVYERTGAAAP